MRIGLFVGCLADTLRPEAGKATVAVLEELGHEVVFPEEQTCCGQMHVNSGYQREALPLIRRFIEVFEDPAIDAVVSPSASCVSMVRHRYPDLASASGDSSLAASARDLGPRITELSEFLVKRLGVEDVGARFPHRVTYHPTCHSLRELRLGDSPLRLLRRVRGMELIELPDAEACCGFGGTFAIKNADTSAAILNDKLRGIESTGAEVCVALDSSCLLQIGGGLSRNRAGVRVMHLAEVLAQR